VQTLQYQLRGGALEARPHDVTKVARYVTGYLADDFSSILFPEHCSMAIDAIAGMVEVLSFCGPQDPDRPASTILLKSPRRSTQCRLDKRNVKRSKNGVLHQFVWQISC
jgi:hypothetical protein